MTCNFTMHTAHRRLHGEIGHIPPVEYEANYYTELTKLQVTTTT
ncbi:hypothetical protein ACQEV4_08545 [Streptomyces shenzhenensis]